MADLKISQLTALATFADDDLYVIVDTSATETKKVTHGAVKTALASAFGLSVPSTQIVYGTGSGITSSPSLIWNDGTSTLGFVGIDATIDVAGNSLTINAGGGVGISTFLQTKEIQLQGATSGIVTIGVPDATTYTLTLPTTDGNNLQFLQTNGSGVLTWATAAIGSFLTTDGATTGATAQAQVFTNGVKAPIVDDNATGGISFTISTVQKAAINTNGITVIDGSAANPSYKFNSNHGFYYKSTTEIGASIAGVLVGGFDANGIFLGANGSVGGKIQLNGLTSGTVTINVADNAGTYGLTLPTNDGNGGDILSTNGGGVLSWIAPSGGSGTVTSFSAGDLSPLFTTSEATVTTTPALSFSLNTQNANKVFAGPATGADAAPTFRVLVAADIPSLSGTYLTVDGATTGATSQAQVFTNGIKTPAIDDNTAGLIEISFSNLVYHQFTDTALQVRSGSIVAPSLSFLSDASSGIYLKGAGAEIGVSVNSALVGGFDATGLFAGLAGTLTGTLKFNGATSGTVTVQSAAAAGTWTLTLPTTDGNSGEFLQTNGSGVTTWAVPAGTGANTALSNLAAVAINTTLLPGSNDGAALGSGTLSFSDLFLASGAVVNFANGNSVITHSSAVLTVSTGDLRVTTAGTNATSVATLDGTQTLTNKSIVATQLTGTAYTMAVNNTSGTAAYTLTNYRNDVIADYDGTFTWNSTPPSTIVSQKYVMSRIGNMVILTISVLYTSTGTTNTTCIVTFPSTAPAPAVLAASGDAASEYMYPITGARVEANQTANPSAIRGGIRRNSGDSAFEILLIFGSTSALQLQVTVIYFTA